QSRATASQVASPAAIFAAMSVADSSLSGRLIFTSIRDSHSVLATLSSRASLRRLGDAAMRLRPAGRVLHEAFDFLELVLVELAALLGDGEDIPPGRQRMQRDAEIGEDLFAFGKDVVEEEHEHMLDHRPGFAQRQAEIDL